jgi:hypothetical protein
MRFPTLLFIGTATVVAACETQQQQVSSMQPQAVQAAQKRGTFELNCPAATAQVLSNEMVQTRSGGVAGWNVPPQRAEYTVGVEGCGKRATYYVVCAEGGTGCVATGTSNEIQQSNVGTEK